MRILLTGVSGFIGRNLLPILLDKGYEVCGISYKHTITNKYKNYQESHIDLGSDLTDSIQHVMRNFNPEIIIHLAGHSTTRISDKDSGNIIDSNIKSTYNLLEYAPQDCKFIYLSTVMCYGDFLERRTEEDECMPKSIYAITKLASEHLINAYCYDMCKIAQPTIFRPCAIIGKNMTHGNIFDFLNKIKSNSPTLQALGKKPGSNKPFLHIDDLIRALIMAINDPYMFGIFNLCLEDELNVEQLAYIMMDILEIKKPIEWMGETFKGDSKIIQCSNQKLKDYGWIPKINNSKDAITKTIKDNEEIDSKRSI